MPRRFSDDDTTPLPPVRTEGKPRAQAPRATRLRRAPGSTGESTGPDPHTPAPPGHDRGHAPDPAHGHDHGHRHDEDRRSRYGQSHDRNHNDPHGHEQGGSHGHDRIRRRERGQGGDREQDSRPEHGPRHDHDHGQSHGHGHGHGHGPAVPVSRRVRRALTAILVPLAVATVVAVVWLYPWGAGDVARSSGATPVDGLVTAATAGSCAPSEGVRVGAPEPGAPRCVVVEVKLVEGTAEGETIRKTIPLEPSTPRFAVGDEVVLAYSGTNPGDPHSYQVKDFQRGGPLLLLGALFVVAVLALGRRQGLLSLVALGISFATITLFVLPAILAGQDPLLVAIAAAGLIMFVALYLTHGFSAQTSVAVLGTLTSLVLIGVLAAVFSSAAALTGLDGDTIVLIASLGHGIDARGLLLAGVVIGALGVLDDITITQASAIWELRRANPALDWRALYGAALRIGRDHVGSAVNTLVLAYAGAALPLLLLSSLSGVGLSSVLESQDIAQELVRTLVGSIGIIAAVPVTTVLAALIAVHDDNAAEAFADGDAEHAEDDVAVGVSDPGSRRTG